METHLKSSLTSPYRVIPHTRVPLSTQHRHVIPLLSRRTGVLLRLCRLTRCSMGSPSPKCVAQVRGPQGCLSTK